MPQRLMRGHTPPRIDRQTLTYKVSSCLRNAPPTFFGNKVIVRRKRCLNFFDKSLSVERIIATEDEVRYYANGPDIADERC
jgi:hypothetical protein